MTPQEARDTLEQPDYKKKRSPNWFPEAPPALVWSDGEPVSDVHASKLLGLLTREGPDSFDPDSWAIFSQLSGETSAAWASSIEAAWLESGAKPAHKWAIFQLAPMRATDRLAERAFELIEMATHGGHKRALWYLETMSRVDDVRLRSWIFDLSINGPYKSTLQQGALTWHNHLVAISPLDRPDYLDTLNLYIREEHLESLIELPDFNPGETRISIPDMGFEGDRAFVTTQDYFITFVGESFDLGLRHPETRKVLSEFPEYIVHDDPTLWRKAKEQFEDIQHTLEPFIKSWQETFEHAMISARPYTYQYLRDTFLDNRLMSHLIASLVWITGEGQGVRLLEGSCFDVEYDEVALSEGATLKLAHPLEVSQEEMQKWGEQLAEDEVFPLFPQFTRELYNAKDHPFSRLKSDLKYSKTQEFMDLLIGSGWRHGEVDYGNYEESYHIMPGRDARVWISHGTLSFNPNGGYYYNTTSPGLHKVHIEDLAGRRIADDKVDPVVYSEAYLLVERLTVAMHWL